MNVTRLGLGTNFKKQHNLGGQLHIAERTAPEAISAATLESETGIDRYTLARGFRARFGSSPHRYPIGRRLERVKAEIARGWPLAESAYDAGFAASPTRDT